MYKNVYNLILVVVGLCAAGLGLYGYSICAEAICHVATWQQRLIGTLNLVRNTTNLPLDKAPWQLLVAQFAIPMVGALAVIRLFFVGVGRDFRVALARRKRNHTIVCGLGDAGMQVVQNLRKAKRDVVAVALDSTSPNAVACEQQKVPVLTGDAIDPNVLRAAGFRRARTIVVCTGDDSKNMDIALQIRQTVDAQPIRGGVKRIIERSVGWLLAKLSGTDAAPILFRRKAVFVELRTDWLFARLANLDKVPLGSADIDLRLFSTYANAARMLLAAFRLPPTPDIKAETFVVAGFGAMGREVTHQIIRGTPVGLGRKLKIIVFDRKAAEHKDKFVEDFPAAAEFADIDFVTADLQTDTPHMRRIVEARLQTEALLGVAVCLHQDGASLYVALEMRALLDKLRQLSAPVFVRLERQHRLGELAGDLEGMARFRNRVSAFGTLEDLFSPEILSGRRLDALAQALHDDYRSRSRHEVNPDADRPWYQLPEYLKMSNRWHADHIPIMLALAGFRLEHVTSPKVLEFEPEETELLARLEHRRWRMERRFLGWQYGPGFDAFERRHPKLVDWQHLDDASRESNCNQVAGLPKILAGLGIEVRREHRVRAYGATLQSASGELERIAATPDGAHVGHDHHVVIADIDDPEGRKVADRAAGLSRMSLWLISREPPKGLMQRSGAAGDEKRTDALTQAEGWARSGGALRD